MFKRIKAIIAEHPQLEEIQIMFVTDGQDIHQSYVGNNYDAEISQVIRDIQVVNGIKSQYLTIGFSQHHDAKRMNEIANSGSEAGNFIFVDTNQGQDVEAKIAEALGDSFDIALGSDAAVKFRIENQQEDFKIVSAAETTYAVPVKKDIANEEEKKGGDDVEDLEEIEVVVTVQQIQKTALINELLTVTMVTKSGDVECAVKVETTEEPKTEMLVKAKLMHNKKRLFDYIQELQTKGKAERKKIYELILQLDKQID